MRRFLAVLVLLSGPTFAQTSDWELLKRDHLLGARATEEVRGGPTTSEGQGMAMLQAVAANDRASFDALWTFAQVRLQQPNGLLAWRWAARPGVVDANNASLGDVYVAWALQRASEAWGSSVYTVHAERLADALLDRCVVQRDGEVFLLPAASGYATELKGSGDVRLNPGHWALPAFRSFTRFERGAEWQALYDSAVRTLPRIVAAGGGRLPALVTWSRGPRVQGSSDGAPSARVAVFLQWTRELPELRASLEQEPGGQGAGLYFRGLAFLRREAASAP